ncbi:hypothetical protein TNCV_4058831 [Trichonephila clavipes]|nr:hypothetical protein TNCV_4058831 [Trichonephila clavipes]
MYIKSVEFKVLPLSLGELKGRPRHLTEAQKARSVANSPCVALLFHLNITLTHSPVNCAHGEILKSLSKFAKTAAFRDRVYIKNLSALSL